MALTVGILAAIIILMVHGKIRADMVALGGVLALMFCGVITPQEALSGFSNPTVLTVAGLFVVGGAVFRTGLASIISHKLLAVSGTSGTSLFLVIMLVTSCIGAFVSNSGTVAVMLPIVASLCASANVSQRRFLMPVAFASSMGGMLTLIGTMSNLIVNGVLVDAGYESLAFFSFFPIGVIIIIVGTLVMLPMTKWLLDAEPDPEEVEEGRSSPLRALSNSYGLTENMFRARVGSDCPLTGKPLRNLDLPAKYHCSVVSICRKSARGALPFSPERHLMPSPDLILRHGDLVTFLGPPENCRAIARDNNLQLQETAARMTNWRFDDIGMTEVVLSSSSSLRDVSVKDSGIRDKYNLAILGIRRNGDIILHDFGDQILQAGDALLLQGKWKDITKLGRRQTEWGVTDNPTGVISREPLTHKAPITAIVIVLMIACMILRVAPNFAIVLTSAMCLVFTGCFRNVQEAYDTVRWFVVVLVAAMFPVTLAVEKTGLVAMVASGIIELAGGVGPHALLGALYAATSITTLFLTNAATTMIFAPIALQIAVAMNLSPYPFMLSVTVAAGMCLASPYSTPANTLVMAPGRYTFMDYVKFGFPLQILYGFVMVFALPLLFPFH